MFRAPFSHNYMHTFMGGRILFLLGHVPHYYNKGKFSYERVGGYDHVWNSLIPCTPPACSTWVGRTLGFIASRAIRCSAPRPDRIGNQAPYSFMNIE